MTRPEGNENSFSKRVVRVIDGTVNVWRKSRGTIDFGSSWRKVGVLLNDNSD